MRQQYVVLSKLAAKSPVRLPPRRPREGDVDIYADRFRTDDLYEGDEFDHEWVVHGDGEYEDGNIHIDTYERLLREQVDTIIYAFQLCDESFHKSGREALNYSFNTTL